MSLTSYRTAPPRVTLLTGCLGQSGSSFGIRFAWREPVGGTAPPRVTRQAPVWRTDARRGCLVRGSPWTCEWVFHGCEPFAPAAMPGDDLLFQRLSVSTIGAARFHGRVRDGIGWGTGAMATRQWGRRGSRESIDALFRKMCVWLEDRPPGSRWIVFQGCR
jgi:hypothetical protein